MTTDRRFARIIADNDQDVAHLLDWWRESSTADKLVVLAAIQRLYDDPVMEIVSRFAQLAFAQTAVRANVEET